MTSGKLFLIPVPLGEDAATVTFERRVSDELLSIRYFIVEDPKSARRALKSMGFPVQELELVPWNEHTTASDASALLEPIRRGASGGLVSDCGAPAVADPGEEVVRAAHRAGIRVVPLPGPSSILLALMGSGLDAERFRFAGYLPKKNPERADTIREVVLAAGVETQVIIETPYRCDQLLAELLDAADSGLHLTVARALTTPTEFLVTKTVAEWRTSRPEPGKIPTVFVIGRPNSYD